MFIHTDLQFVLLNALRFSCFCVLFVAFRYSSLSAELLPTPAKSHYTFNLRDISKVFQGTIFCHPPLSLLVPVVLRGFFPLLFPAVIVAPRLILCVCAGILMIRPQMCSDPDTMTRLWIHEVGSRSWLCWAVSLSTAQNVFVNRRFLAELALLQRPSDQQRGQNLVPEEGTPTPHCSRNSFSSCGTTFCSGPVVCTD